MGRIDIPGQDDACQGEGGLPPERLLVDAVQRAVELAQSLGEQQALAATLARRVDELVTIREFSSALVGTIDAAQVADALVIAARTAFPDGAASIVAPGRDGGLAVVALAGMASEPLLSGGRRALAQRLHSAGRPAFHRELRRELLMSDPVLIAAFAPFCTAATVPVEMAGRQGMLVAYGTDAGNLASLDAVSFLSSLAAQASLGFENAERHSKLVVHGAELEVEVAARTLELRVAHEELAAVSRMKDRILSSINHELRTPVTKLLAAAQALDRVKPTVASPVAPPFAAIIVSQARQLASLLDQVLAAHELLVGDASAVAEEVLDVDRAMESAAFAWHERATARGVRVAVEPHGQGVAVLAGAGAVTLILSQLVDNALKFTAPGTEVRVRVLSHDAYRVRVVVEDHGPGVPQADAERIFAEFDQGGGDVLTSKPNGLGLGLVIARRMARRLGGDVGVTSTSAGSCFWLELPAAERAVTVVA